MIVGRHFVRDAIGAVQREGPASPEGVPPGGGIGRVAGEIIA